MIRPLGLTLCRVGWLSASARFISMESSWHTQGSALSSPPHRAFFPLRIFSVVAGGVVRRCACWLLPLTEN